MNNPNLRLAWAAAPVSHPKEPPQRSAVTSEESVADLVAEARDAFKYDWRSRLNDVRPATHPKMRYDSYREDKEKLFTAVKILNATPFVDSDRAAARVLAAFARLRDAAHLQNEYNNREFNCGMDRIHLEAADMKALLELTVYTPKGSALRQALESSWLYGMSGRYTEDDGWRLRNEAISGLRQSIPNSDEAVLYERFLLELGKFERETRIEASSLRLAANE